MRFFLFDLGFIVLIFPLVLILIAALVAGSLLGPLSIIPILCCLVPFFIIALIASMALKETGERLLVLEDKGVVDTFKESFHTVVKNITAYIMAALVMLIPGCVFGGVMLIVSLTTLLPLLFLCIGLVSNDDTVMLGLGLGVGGICMLSLLISLLRAPFQVFTNTYWTKFIAKLRES
jgi:hypothetical protein